MLQLGGKRGGALQFLRDWDLLRGFVIGLGPGVVGRYYVLEWRWVWALGLRVQNSARGPVGHKDVDYQINVPIYADLPVVSGNFYLWIPKHFGNFGRELQRLRGLGFWGFRGLGI